MSSYPIAQLSAFCSAHPISTKVLFVPSEQAGQTLVAALASSGSSWLNLHVTTPSGWAERVSSPHLHAEGRTPLPPDADRFFLDELIARALKRVPESPFTSTPISPGLARSFLRTLRTLRRAGIDPDHLEHTSDKTARTHLLAALYREYLALLEVKGFYDSATCFEYAIHLLAQSGPSQDTFHAILDETPLSGLAFKYLKTLISNGIYRIGRPNLGTPPPDHSAAVRFPDAPFPKAERAQPGPGGNLLLNGLTPEHCNTIRLRETLGAETEVRGVFREILHENIPLDQVEIAYTAKSPYLSLLQDAVERFHLSDATTFANGIPLTLTRPGQAILGFYRWIGANFDATELIDLCRADLLTFSSLSPDTPLEPYRVAMLLHQERISQGRNAYSTAFDRLEANHQDRLEQLRQEDLPTEHIEESYRNLDTVRTAVQKLLALVPATPKTSLESLTHAGITFLKHFAPCRMTPDTDAADALHRRLHQTGRTVQVENSPSHLARYLVDLLSQDTVHISATHHGRLAIAPLDRAGYTGRKHLYVLGMDESSFPGGGAEDPILLDGERITLSADLELHRTRPGEQVWHLVRLLGAAPGPVTLFSSRRSLADGRETYPSAVFQQAASQLEIEHPPVLNPVPPSDLALDDTELLLSTRTTAGFEITVRNAFPWLVQGETAAHARSGPQLTRFDGRLSTPDAHLDLTSGNTVVSASRLETLARCPYRYFLQYVLRVEPPEEREEDATRWLTPLAFGALLHDLFCAFMKTLQHRKESPNLEKHTELLDKMLQEHVKLFQEHNPVTHEAAYRADLKRLSQAARAFLATESQHKTQPEGFEVSFGFGESGGLNQPEPIPISLSKSLQVRLRGRIDRVDREHDNYTIWDYKTGSMAGYSAQNLLKGGIHLQWALYTYALESILRNREHPGRVSKSGYFFTSDREHGQRISDTPPPPTQLANLLAPLLNLVAEGYFFHLQKEHQCTFCEYNRICGKEAVLPSALKDLNPAMDNEPDLLRLINQWMNG